MTLQHSNFVEINYINILILQIVANYIAYANKTIENFHLISEGEVVLL